ncbi:hypothetical protein RFI_21143, partial [Reticulomyxa filosa]
MNVELVHVIADELLDDKKYQHLKWLNLSQTSLANQKKKEMILKLRKIGNNIKKEKEKESNVGSDKEQDLVKILCNGLRRNRSLQILHLSKNRAIDNVAWNEILQSLSVHPQLWMLVYNTNALNVQQCQMLGDFFGTQPNPSLAKISLESCGITDDL